MTAPLLTHWRRLLMGMAEALAVKEYSAVTVSDIVAAAAVSKRTFYQHFSDKQECLLACYAQANDMLVEAIRQESVTSPKGLPRLHRMLDAYLGFLDQSRATTVALLVEITSAGAEGRRVRRETNLVLAGLLQEISGVPGAPRLDLPQAVALVGGVLELVLLHAETSPETPFTELRPDLLRFVSAVLGP